MIKKPGFVGRRDRHNWVLWGNEGTLYEMDGKNAFRRANERMNRIGQRFTSWWIPYKSG